MVPDIVPQNVDTPPLGRRRSVGFLICIFLLFTVLTAVMTYPQVRHMNDAVHDPGDPLLNLWALRWVAHQLPSRPRIYSTRTFSRRERRTLAYSETLLAPPSSRRRCCGWA